MYTWAQLAIADGAFSDQIGLGVSGSKLFK